MDYAFYNDPVDEITLPSSLGYIGMLAFSKTNIRNIIIPENTESIGYGAFADCTALTDITILNPECIMFSASGHIECDICSFCQGGPFCFSTYEDADGNVMEEGPKCTFNGTIYGYPDSSAQDYAEYCGYKFSPTNKEKNGGFGDTDLNGIIDMSDLTALSLYLLGDSKLGETALKNADVTGDGKTDIADLAMLKQYIMHDDVQLGPVK